MVILARADYASGIPGSRFALVVYTEPLAITLGIKAKVNAFYQDTGRFPSADKLLGNRITSIEVANGAIHVALGNKVSQPLQGKVLSFRPAVVEGSPESPIAWLCGYDQAVPGMRAVGDNRTDIDPVVLPSVCRKPS